MTSCNLYYLRCQGSCRCRLDHRRTGGLYSRQRAAKRCCLRVMPANVEQRFTSLSVYLHLLHEQAANVLQIGELLDHPTVASTWSLSQAQINAEAPAAADLLALCAFVAPDDIPRDLPAEHTALLPPQLRHAAADPLSYHHALGTLGRYSMVTATADTINVHRLLQAWVRAGLDPDTPAMLGQRGCPPRGGCIPGDASDMRQRPTSIPIPVT